MGRPLCCFVCIELDYGIINIDVLTVRKDLL